MIELIVKKYLDSKLNVPVHLEHLKKEVDKFIILEKTSGSYTNHLKKATVAIQSYAGSLYEAATLNESVKETMFNIVELSEIVGIKLNSDYNFTDTETKKYRYQAVFDINYY